MNTIKFEIKQYYKFTIIWQLAFIMMITVFLQMAPMFTKDSEAILQMFEGFNGSYLEAMGINIDTFFGFSGFYGYISIFISLLAAIQAIYIGIDIFSKEKRMKTADFLFTKPQSRTNIFLAKYVTAVLILIITQIILNISTYIGMKLIGEGIEKSIILINISFSLLQFIFLSLGAFIAVIAKKIKSVVSISVGIGILSFIVGMFSSLVDNNAIKYLAILKYFDTNYIITNNSYEAFYVGLSIAIITAATFLSYIIYVKKDIAVD